MQARARLSKPEPRLDQSLRYAALARAERASVVKVLHSWIALETLSRGQGAPLRPYPFLMRHLSSMLAAHAVRQGLAATWHIASRAGRHGWKRGRWRQIEAWLGVVGTHRRLGDLNRWLDLMRYEVPAGTVAPTYLRRDAPIAEAAAMFDDVVSTTFPPFAQQAIERWRWRLASGSRLSNWCDEIEQRSKSALGRMYSIRNSTVHTALTQARASGQLAHAADNIVDTVYEVLPRWLRANEAVWRALARLERRSNHVRRTWNRHPRAATLNADKLTSPGGDGLSR